MAVRQIVHIDENKCNGCGLCVPNCAEGAIQIIDGKAKLVAENLCDGLGACLGHCPLDAIWVEERNADEFDEGAVEKHLGNMGRKVEKHEQKTGAEATACACNGGHSEGGHGHSEGGHGHGEGGHGHGGGCPGSRARAINRENKESAPSEKTGPTASYSEGDIEVRIKPQLQQWPVQLMLVPPTADYFKDADLLITADCVPFAYPNFHLDILKGKKLVVGCPKLDDVEYYTEKITAILSKNNIKSLTVAFMEVPCCGGIVRAAQKALADSGKDIPLHLIRITIEGGMQVIS